MVIRKDLRYWSANEKVNEAIRWIWDRMDSHYADDDRESAESKAKADWLREYLQNKVIGK